MEICLLKMIAAKKFIESNLLLPMLLKSFGIFLPISADFGRKGRGRGWILTH